MRASVMLHLPALSITNQIDKLLYGVSQLGVAVRGVYGEGTKSIGHLYQISNQGTLGASEETLIDKINQIVMQIIDKEKNTREHLMKNNYDDLEDEAMKLLSLIKLGSEMGITPMVKGKNIYQLMIWIQPNNISTIDAELSPKDRDKKRAEIIRRELLR
jgi:protein arginine kinase